MPWLEFGEDRTGTGVPAFRVDVCAERRGPVRCAPGLVLQATGGLPTVEKADLVIVPSWDMQRQPSPRLLRALQRAHANGATVVGLCLGAFVLAEAGLLHARGATTHWYWARAFRERYPDVRLQAEVLYVDDERLGAVLAWAGEHLHEPHTIASLAARAALSRRTFTRQFQKATGMSMLQWLLQRRLAAARRLLEGGTQSVEAIAAATGFGSPASLRQHFARTHGLSPQAFRRQFRQG